MRDTIVRLSVALQHRAIHRALQIAAVALALGLFAWVDRAIGGREGGGPYRAEIPRPIRAVQRAQAARHVVLGCSTSNWFADTLVKAWQVEASALVDAHMSDCLQSCTLAEARRLQALGRHFETASFGVNSFEYCEQYRERRSMQEVELMPLSNSLELARLYLYSREPLRHAGGWLMNHLSLVYGNTMWLQRHTRKAVFGNESPNANWFRQQPLAPRRREGFGCDYAATDRDYGLAATRAALVALEALADRVLLVVLPDRAYAEETPEARATRELITREHRELVSHFERVELIELLDPKLMRRELFRDGAHLNAKGLRAARSVFMAKLAELPKPPRAPSASSHSGASRASRDTGPLIETDHDPRAAEPVERSADVEAGGDVTAQPEARPE